MISREIIYSVSRSRCPSCGKNALSSARALGDWIINEMVEIAI